jgi:hypothetical protein
MKEGEQANRVGAACTYSVKDCSFCPDGIYREVGGSNLLRNATSFAFLDICLTDLS